MNVSQRLHEARARKVLKTFVKRVKKDAERSQKSDKKLHRNLPPEYFIENSNERLDFGRIQQILGMEQAKALAWTQHQECTARILGYRFRLVESSVISGYIHELRVHHVSSATTTLQPS